jgi:hypothetical protein
MGSTIIDIVTITLVLTTECPVDSTNRAATRPLCALSNSKVACVQIEVLANLSRGTKPIDRLVSTTNTKYGVNPASKRFQTKIQDP